MRTTLRWSAYTCLCLTCLAGGCSVNTNPELPTWDAEFNVPLGTKTTFLSEWVDESDDLVEDPSGVVTFRFQGTLDPTAVGDRLTVGPIEASLHPTIGAFELEAPARQQTELVFGELWPLSQTLTGQTAPVPGFQFQDVESAVPELDGFHSMTLEAGLLTVVVSNQLPVPIENVSLAVIDESSSAVIASLDFPWVAAAGTDSSSADLSGRTVTHRVRVRASGGSPGSGGNWVPIDAGAGVVFEAALGNLRAIAASAELPATEFERTETADIPEGMIVTEAEIARGDLHIEFENDLPVAVAGSLDIPEFRNPSGVPLTLDVYIPAEGRNTSDAALDGYTLAAAPPPPGEAQVLTLRAAVSTEETGEIVTLDAADGLAVDARFDTLSFHQVSGILDGTVFEVSPTTQDVDFPEDLDAVSLGDARLTLQLVSDISIPLFVSLEAVGRSEKGTVVTLPIEIEFAGAGKSAPDTARVVLDPNNSTVLDFLNNLPSTVTVGGEARVGDGQTEGTVSRDDAVEGSFTFEVPLHLAFDEQVIESALTEIEILPENGDVDGGDNAVDGELSRRMKAARLWVTFVNHTAVGAAVTVAFAVDSTLVFSGPDLALDPVELNPGVVDESGSVVQATTSENSLVLAEEDLDLFRNSGAETKTVYLGTTIRLLSTEGRAVKICGSDYVRTQARICFTAAVETPEDK